MAMPATELEALIKAALPDAEVDITLQSGDAIRAYEERQRVHQPWVARGTGLAA